MFGISGQRPKTAFSHSMKVAHSIAQQNPAALVDLIKVLLRPRQSSLLVDVIQKAQHKSCYKITREEFFCEGMAKDRFDDYELPKLVNNDYKLYLNSDTLLPCPWERGRIARSLSMIGSGKEWGNWEQDPDNHFVSLWLPWRIGFVEGGNHSITAGIIAGEGTITPEQVTDFSHIFNEILCDGEFYRDAKTGQEIAKVISPDIAAVFEIGRLMIGKA